MIGAQAQEIVSEKYPIKHHFVALLRPGGNSLIKGYGYVQLMEVGLGSLIFMAQGLKFMKHCKIHRTGSKIRKTG